MASVIKNLTFDAADALAPGLTVMQDPEGSEFCVEPGPSAGPG
jgi:hypothetical protein